MVVIIGVDPGIHGAVAFLHVDGNTGKQWPELVHVLDLPTEKVGEHNRLDLVELRATIGRLLTAVDPARIKLTIEDVHAAPGQGVSSMFRFGFAAGALTGLFTGMGVSPQYITPQVWRRRVGVNEQRDSLQRVVEIFPAKAELFRRKMDHNRADAALIALSRYLVQ